MQIPMKVKVFIAYIGVLVTIKREGLERIIIIAGVIKIR
jgi:high-affinity Fe2+/Pb2+ permease